MAGWVRGTGQRFIKTRASGETRLAHATEPTITHSAHSRSKHVAESGLSACFEILSREEYRQKSMQEPWALSMGRLIYSNIPSLLSALARAYILQPFCTQTLSIWS